MLPKFACTFVLALCLGFVAAVKYTPDWPSIDSRPLPAWYDEAKFGIFIHWGVFSVPAFGNEWFWHRWQKAKEPSTVKFMKENYPPSFTYADFGKQFTAEMFEPDKWADMLEASGAKYVVLTSKHHEGFTLWPSKVSFNWNSMALGAKKDLVGLLASAIRNRTNMHFGLYHSMYEWFNPLYLQDASENYSTQYFVEGKTMPELYEIVNAYKPDVIWSDGDWEAPYTYWNSTQFLAWLYNESPVKDTVVVNDRWGKDIKCKHGGYLTCHDKYNPGILQKRKWENAFTIDKHAWGYRRNTDLSDYLSNHELLSTMVETFSCGGNVLLNVGPTHYGHILPIFEERLRDIGSWLKVNGEAVYSSSPWKHQNDSMTTGVWYTTQKTTKAVYAFLQKWPQGGSLVLGSVMPTSQTTVSLLGYTGSELFKWSKNPSGGIMIKMPTISFLDMPCKDVWALKLTHLQ